MTYSEKLRDPRWQKRRLEIMSRAQFSCENCGSSTETLNVHHSIYKRGIDPWEYEDSALHCLCESCHSEEHALRDRLGMALMQDRAILECVVGYAEGLQLLTGELVEAEVYGHEYARGLGAAFRVGPEAVIALCKDGVVTAYDLGVDG